MCGAEGGCCRSRQAARAGAAAVAAALLVALLTLPSGGSEVLALSARAPSASATVATPPSASASPPPPPSPSAAATPTATPTATATETATSSATATASPWAESDEPRAAALAANGACTAFSSLGLGPPPPAAGAPPAFLVVQRSGGLGNQLFQIVTGIVLALASQRMPLLGPSPVDNLHATAAYEPTVLRRVCSAPAALTADAGAALAQPGDAFTYAGVAAPAGAPAVVTTSGYWQDPRYLTPLAPGALRALLAPPPALMRRLAADYGPFESCAAVHVRRGDYVAKRDFHGVMEMPYFEAALRRANASGALPPGTRLLVLSDDIAWARAQPGFVARGARFVDGEDEVASFYLLGACRRALLCPNSTFCWWAAFLGRDDDGRTRRYVAMPRRWIAPPLSAENIYFDGVDIIADADFVTGARALRAARHGRRATLAAARAATL